MVSNYTNMSVAADFNGWNAGANNMHLVDHYTWQYTIGLDLPAGAEFKFAAEGTWAVNWGETNQPAPFTDPLQGDAETNGGNIFVSGPLNGTYVFQFNDNSRAYRFTRSQVPDFDQDGMTDDWEDSHGFDARNGSDAGIDSDNDLLINLDEFRNVTDPHVAGTQAADPASKLMLGGVATGGMFRVTWPGASGRTYNLLQSADLQGGPWSPVTGHTNLGGVNGTMNADVSVTPGPSVFYRIDVRKNTP
jgi:hypothetical protein